MAISKESAHSAALAAAPSNGGKPRREVADLALAGLAQLAAISTGCPVASIAIHGSETIWCSPAGEIPRGATAPRDPFAPVSETASTVIEMADVAQDPRFEGADFNVHGIAVRFYAGLALRSRQGEPLGTLAVYGPVRARLSAEQRRLLTGLGEQAVLQIEVRSSLAEMTLVSDDTVRIRVAASRAFFGETLLESAPVAIYHTDGAGNSEYFNSAYRDLFGMRADSSDSDWANFVHPEDRERMQAAWADFRANPREVRFEYRTDPGRGPGRHLAEQVVPVANGNGFVGSITDVTDLMTARADLRRVETLFRHTFEQAPIGVAYQDRSGAFLRCNQAFCKLLGYRDPGDLSSKTIADLTHPDDVPTTLEAFERLWNGKVPFVDYEKRYRHKDGRDIWVRLTTALVHEGDGTPDRAVEFLRDISVRKQLAAELLRQQTLLQAVIADMPLALLACDASGTITHSNHAAVELFGLPDSFVTSGESWPITRLAMHTYLADGVTPVDGDELPLARALAGEVSSDLELVIAPPNSSPRTTLANARRLAGPGGQTLGAVAVWQDVTERKAADLEIERVNKQLMTASRQAGMAEVATNVLHNVGNILNSINVSASLLADRVKQSKVDGLGRVAAMLKEQGANVGTFLSSDERGKRIPDYLASLGAQLAADQKASLQEVASLRANLEHIKETVAMQQSYAKLCGVTETVNVTDLVEDSLRLNAGAFARHGVTLKREFAEVEPIIVDKHKVLQILVNLVRNAKYACDESGRQDKLLTLRVEPTANGVAIAVIDNGVGIAPENMGRLFHHGFTTRQSGHGFGLHSGAVAAQELGGTLRAASDGLGHGATFTLELPRTPGGVARV